MSYPFTKELMEAGMSPEDYVRQFNYCADNNLTTGAFQNQEYAEYTRLNWERFKRASKRYQPSAGIISRLSQIESKQYWVLLTETWCGDASQTVPVIFKIASLCPNVVLKVFLRDQKPDIINGYLTNGGKSIPKLIVLNERLSELWQWGPRPASAFAIYKEFKATPGMQKLDFYKKLHLFYAQNCGAETEEELSALLTF